MTNIRGKIHRELAFKLKSVPCTDCGGFFPHYIMEFDHVPERGPKLFSIGAAISQHMPLSRLLKEVSKCDVVCSNCHRTRTYKRRMMAMEIKS